MERGSRMLVGLLGLLLIAGGALAGENAALAGQAPGKAAGAPPAEAAEVAQEQLAEKFIAEFLAPLPEPKPAPGQQAEIESVLKGFAAEDFQAREAASAAAAGLGTWALAAIRRAAASPDLEVAERARLAVGAIERAAREATTAELRKLAGVSEPLLRSKLEAAKRTWANLALSVSEAERKDDPERAKKLQADIQAADRHVDALKRLLDAVAGTTPGPAGDRLSSGAVN